MRETTSGGKKHGSDEPIDRPNYPRRHTELTARDCICDGKEWYTACPCGPADFASCPDSGKAFPCVCKLQAHAGTRRDTLHASSGLAFAQRTRLTMSTFEPERHPVSEQMFNAAGRFVTGGGKQWLYVWGTTGAGKTHLAAAIVNALVAQGVEAYYTTATDLYLALKDAELGVPDDEGGVMTYTRLLRKMAKLPVLVIDDVKPDQFTAGMVKYLEAVLDKRYTAEAATVITSNFKPDVLPERWQSRLGDEKLVTEMVAEMPDQRAEWYDQPDESWDHQARQLQAPEVQP